MLSAFSMGCVISAHQQTDITVSAAASLTDVLKEINLLYTAQHSDVNIITNFASSGTLQSQIENGAPVDVFISAASAQMNSLERKGLLLNETLVDLLNNKIVVIVPGGSTLGITSLSDLASDRVKKVAIGDPKSVPVGTYAQQAFDTLGINDKITPKEVLAGDPRQILTYVEGNNVDAGIVYSSDALTSSKVKVVAGVPEAVNANIVYSAAVIKASRNQKAAGEYLDFLSTANAQVIFEKYGFTVAVK